MSNDTASLLYVHSNLNTGEVIMTQARFDDSFINETTTETLQQILEALIDRFRSPAEIDVTQTCWMIRQIEWELKRRSR